jgi:hypothetical protein
MLEWIKNEPDSYLPAVCNSFKEIKNSLSSMLKDGGRSVEYFTMESVCRNAFIEIFGWALLTPNNIHQLHPYVDGKTILSVNSGCAFVEACIAGLTSARIICTDKVEQESAFMPVQVKDAFQAVVDNPEADVLLSSWPEYIMPDETSPFLGRKVNKKECAFCSTKRNKSLSEKRSAYRRFLKESYPKRRKGISRKQIEKEIDRLVNNYNPSTLLPTKMNLCSSCISSYNEYDSAYHALCIFRGDTFILIGEGEDGCTGSKNLFDLLERKWTLIDSDVIYHPNWPGIHSCVQIYVRK